MADVIHGPAEVLYSDAFGFPVRVVLHEGETFSQGAMEFVMSVRYYTSDEDLDDGDDVVEY